MGFLSDTQNCGLCMRRECRERFPRHWLKGNRKLTIPACITARASRTCPWCMSESLTRAGGENVPGIPGSCTTRNFAYLVRGPWMGEMRCPLWVQVSVSFFLPLTHWCRVTHICVSKPGHHPLATSGADSPHKSQWCGALLSFLCYC